MPLAIETVIIVIVIVSFTVLCAVIFALYWLWRLLLEDRRCSRMENSTSWPPHVRQESGYTPIVPSTATETPPIHRCVCNTAEATDAPVSRPIVFPRILRPFNIIIDERKRRSVSGKRSNWNSRRPTEHLPVPTTPEAQEVAAIAEVLVLDGTEPPPPYEEIC